MSKLREIKEGKKSQICAVMSYLSMGTNGGHSSGTLYLCCLFFFIVFIIDDGEKCDFKSFSYSRAYFLDLGKEAEYFCFQLSCGKKKHYQLL